MRDGQRLDGKPDGVFVCVVVAVLDPSTGECHLASAGMELPLLLRAATGDVEVVEGTAHGTILGALPTWEGAILTLHLDPGDILLLYTDGLTEARRLSPGARQGKGTAFFGPEGVARALRDAAPLGALEGMAGAIVGETKAFAGGSLGDDVCLLLARRTANR